MGAAWSGIGGQYAGITRFKGVSIPEFFFYSGGNIPESTFSWGGVSLPVGGQFDPE